MFDLKKIREERGMTQQNFADALNNNKISEDDENVTQEMVSRYENNSKSVPGWYLQKIQMYTGENLFAFKPKLQALDVKETIYKHKFLINHIQEHISKNYSYSDGKYSDRDGVIIKHKKYENYITGIKALIEKLDRKPRVVLVGNSDTGKSTMINTLVGQEIMPTKWQPYTTIPVFVKHKKDRPSFITSDVVVFKESEDEKLFDIEGIKEQRYFEEWKLRDGSSSLLREYGTRENGGDELSCGAAVMYANAPILENVDIIDLPGFNTDRPEDDIISTRETGKADVLIFLSQANGFLRKHEFEYLLEAMKRLKVIESNSNEMFEPLSNLFVIAAHADNIGTSEEREFILGKGSERLSRIIPDGYWEEREKKSGYIYDENTILSRLYAYSNNNRKIREKFEKDFIKVIEDLSSYSYEFSVKELKQCAEFYKENIEREIIELENILVERDKYKLILNSIQNSEGKRAIEAEANKRTVLSKIKEYMKEAENEIEEIFKSTIEAESIVEKIKNKGYKKNKDDIEALITHLNQTLNLHCEKTLMKKSENLSKDIERYLGEMKNSFEINLNMNIKELIDFDVRNAFVAGLAGAATFGALGVWAAVAAAGSNLGAYILLAQGVSVLSALGISLGGTATVASAVAMIGGPVTIAIALAMFAALGVFAILSGGWENKLAKKLVSEYNAKNTLEAYKGLSKKYWDETETAFIFASGQVEKKWKEYISDLEEKVNSYSIEDINSLKDEASKILNFFLGIPKLL